MADDPFDVELAERMAVFDRVDAPAPADVQGRVTPQRSWRRPASAVAATLVVVAGIALALTLGDDDPDVATGVTTTLTSTTITTTITTTIPPSSSSPAPPATLPGAVAIAGTGTTVDVNDVRDLWPRATPQGDIPASVGDLELFGTKVITLADGRAVVRGRWARDDEVETTFAFRTAEGFQEPTAAIDHPIRLFVVDWDTEMVVPVSPLTDFFTIETAMGRSFGYELPLEWELADDETVLRFTTGFNGAAYDIPYTLWEAPIPPAR